MGKLDGIAVGLEVAVDAIVSVDIDDCEKAGTARAKRADIVVNDLMICLLLYVVAVYQYLFSFGIGLISCLCTNLFYNWLVIRCQELKSQPSKVG